MNKGFRAVRGEGILLDPKDQIEITYSWGIEENMNNIVKALSIWQGISQMIAHNMKGEMVFGDSHLIIQALVTNSIPSQMRLRQISRRIQTMVKYYRRIELNHILRGLNDDAYKADTIGSSLSKWTLNINDKTSCLLFPKYQGLVHT